MTFRKQKGGFISPIYTLDTRTLNPLSFRLGTTQAWSKRIGALQKFLSQSRSSKNLQAKVNFHCSKDLPLCAH